MTINVIFATYSNSTALAAEYLASLLRQAGHTVTLTQAAVADTDTFANAEAIVLASPSWDYNGDQGMPHEDFAALMQRLPQPPVTGKKLAVLGLGDMSFTYFCGAVDHLTKWLEQAGGTISVEPLRIDGYYSDEIKAKTQIETWNKQFLVALG